MKRKNNIPVVVAICSLLATLPYVVYLLYSESNPDTAVSFWKFTLISLEETASFLKHAMPLVLVIVGNIFLFALSGSVLILLTRQIFNGTTNLKKLFNSFFKLFGGFRVSTEVDFPSLQPGVAELNKLIEYSHRRKEIEEEIHRLTDALMKSDVAEFADVNRLVISGQNQVWTNGSIDYHRFFKQFGINPDEIKVKKDFALFLTPFTLRGEAVFLTCQRTLNKLGILLQMTDNAVGKDDIMMNIVTKILEASFLIVNIDGRNPNVYYELGIAHALGKPTILISNSNKPEEEHGFDVRQKNMILYRDYEELERELLYRLNDLRA